MTDGSDHNEKLGLPTQTADVTVRKEVHPLHHRNHDLYEACEIQPAIGSQVSLHQFLKLGRRTKCPEIEACCINRISNPPIALADQPAGCAAGDSGSARVNLRVEVTALDGEIQGQRATIAH